ncbi:MAG: AraC family transcriptional regulator [Christensenellales bacterium]
MFYLVLDNMSESIFHDQQLPTLRCIHQILDYKNWKQAYHRHEDFCEIVLVLDGENNIKFDDTNYIAKKGDLILFNKKQLHHERDNIGLNLHMISLAINNLHIRGLEEGQIVPIDKSPVVPTGDYFEFIKSCMLYILEECKHQEEGYEYRCQTFVISLIALITQNLWKERKQDEHRMNRDDIREANGVLAAYKVKEYIDEHYNVEINMDKLAREFHYSTYYIAHEFKKAFDISTMQYLVYRRMGEAQMLLLKTDKPVNEIARDVGYDNINNFFVQFKKSIGFSPNTFRQISRGGSSNSVDNG